MQDSLQENSANVTLKSAVFNIILVVTTLCWYLCFFSFLKNNSGFTDVNYFNNINCLVIIFGINLVSTIVFAVLGTKIIQKIEKRLKFIICWLIVGVLLSSLTVFIGNSSFFYVVLISSIVGAYFGFGFPIVLGYYSNSVKNVYRARISGLIIFFFFFCFICTSVLARSTLSLTVALILWKLCGLFAIWFLKPSDEEVNKVEEEKVSYKNVICSRQVLFYFIPWLMFSLVNNFALPVLYTAFDASIVDFMTQFEVVIAGISAIFFGFFADRFGRKRLLFFGFVLLGLGYALLGLFPTYARGFLFYTIADGISWGIFITLFLLTLWGDIAGKRDAEKFFVIGFLPYLLSNFLQVLFGRYIASSLAVDGLSAVFSFACFFLFITAIPLYLAPETLPERDKQMIDLRKYYEKAKIKADKEAEKSQKANRATDNANNDAADV
jgi:MFS family permease